MSRLQVRVGESRALRAKEHRRRCRPSFADDTCSHLAHVGNPNVRIAIARSRGRHERALGNRIADGVDDACPIQNVIGAGCTGGGVAMRKLLRPHENQLIERHILHRPRRRPDVAGVGRLDQHDTNVGGVHLIG